MRKAIRSGHLHTLLIRMKVLRLGKGEGVWHICVCWSRECPVWLCMCVCGCSVLCSCMYAVSCVAVCVCLYACARVGGPSGWVGAAVITGPG